MEGKGVRMGEKGLGCSMHANVNYRGGKYGFLFFLFFYI